MGKINKKQLGISKLSIGLLLIVILITIGLYGYNYYLDGQNQKIIAKISEKQKEIDFINKDENIKVYNLMKSNQKVLNKLESYSQITRFMSGIKYIEDNYSLYIEGFHYSNGEISLKATSKNTNYGNAYIIVSNFIKKYREDGKTGVDKDKIDFYLPFISKIDGSDQMKFNIKLKVKDNLIK